MIKQKIKFTKKHFNRNRVFEVEMLKYINSLDKNLTTKNEKQLMRALRNTLSEIEFLNFKLSRLKNTFSDINNRKKN